MILELLIGISGAILVFIMVSVSLTFAKQYQMNKYFKKVSPNLPLAQEYTSIYGGHAKTIALNPRNCYLVDNLHKKIGKTFGLYYTTLPAVSTMDLDLIKQFILDEPDKNINRSKLKTPIDEIEIDSIATADSNQWRKLRQASAPAFTNHKIKSNLNVGIEIKETIEKFAESLEKAIDKSDDKSSTTLDVDDIFHRYTIDLVFKCFYKQKNLISYNFLKPDHYVELIGEGLAALTNPIVTLCVVFPFLYPILTWLVRNFTSQGKMRNDILNFIKIQTKLNFQARKELHEAKLLAEKNSIKFDPDSFTLKNGEKFSRNLIDYFIDQFHDGKLTFSEYINSGSFIFYAANKTTADALSMLIYHLAINPEIQEKLRESILKDGEESEYLLWAMNESMRLFPPAPMGCSRKIDWDYKTKDGIFIPKGTIVLTSSYSIHRSKEYWGEDAEEFNPDRWANSKDFHPCQYLTFGLGRRNCIGKSFALHEMKMLMNVLMRRFKFERSPKTTDNNLFSSPIFIFLVFDQPHYVKISKLVT